MARPRLGKDVSLRVQLVIPAELVQQIEDWRFANRIASTSEAIRLLVSEGLLAHSAKVRRHVEFGSTCNNVDFWEAFERMKAKTPGILA